MIGYLKGKIIKEDLKSVILDVSGVGYKIHTNTGSLSKKKDLDIEFWTYLAVRENALDLYGFTNKEELSFFELLITVSGIGPKSAMGILTVASLPNLHYAVKTGDIGHLTKVSGVGKKNAEKIVIELKDKIEKITNELSHSESGEVDALEALQALGFSERDSREALRKVTDIKDAGDKIKKALKFLP